MKTIKINGVEIGDVFNYQKNIKCIVVDFLEQKSMTTGKVISHVCIAKGLNTIATNLFDVPFSTVVRNKIK